MADFSIQSDEPMTAGEASRWFKSRIAEMRQQGAKYCRASARGTASGTVFLAEGWYEQPAPGGRDDR